MALQGSYRKGDVVEVFRGSHKPKAGGDKQYATVMGLAGTKMIDIVLEKAGRPRTNIMVTSVRPVHGGSRVPGVKAVNSPPQKGAICTTCGECVECKMLKQEIGILARALSEICNLRQGDGDHIASNVSSTSAYLGGRP